MNILKKLLAFLSIILCSAHAMDKGMYEFTFQDRQIKQPSLYEEAVLEHSSHLLAWKQKKDVMLPIISTQYEAFFKELFRFLPKTVRPASVSELKTALSKIQLPQLSKVIAALGLQENTISPLAPIVAAAEENEIGFVSHEFDPAELDR